MATARGKGEKREDQGAENAATVKLEDDLNALFKLPLTEFTAARNILAARLKKTGHSGEAERVKALPKPPVSAWTVNQLYWRHGGAFDQLIAAGERFRQAHALKLAGKTSDTREPLAARRETLSALSRLADALLRDAGHNPGPETMRRITTTLEALSAYPAFSDASRPGHLTNDIEPPGFESLATTPVSPFQPSASTTAGSVSKREERQAKIASAKTALQAAELTLRDTRTRAQDVAAILRKVTAHANETEKDKREARERFETASVAAEEARHHLQSVAAEAEKAAKALEDAERNVEKARKEMLHSAG